MTTSLASSIPADAVPVLTGAKPRAEGLTPTDWFVFSRVDGTSSVRLLGQMVGLPMSEFEGSVRRLVESGVIALRGAEKGQANPPPPVQLPSTSSHHAAAAPSQPVPRATVPSGSNAAIGPRSARPAPTGDGALSASVVPAGWPVPFERFALPPDAAQEGSALSDEQRKVIAYFHAHLRNVTYYDLLGIPHGASSEAVRTAYFRLSKSFHPDRWFRRDTGAFEHRIVDVFKWLNRAYMVLSSPKKRKGYDRLLQQGYVGEWQLEEQPGARAAARSAAAEAAGAVASGGTAPVSQAVHRMVIQETSSEASTRTPLESRVADPSRVTAALLIRARKATADGDWSGAADAYLRAVQLQPSVELRILAIECMLKANVDPTEVDREVRSASEGHAGDTRLLTLEAEVARRLGDVDRARDCYDRVLAIEPQNPVARLGLERLAPTE